ncbi:MAG: alkaline phosphatase family protein [Methylococcales bacterium]
MKKLAITLAVSALLNGVAFADQDDHNHAIPHLDHVFVIVMENHAFGQIIGNADAPFINAYASQANLATNYYGVGHPSLTNYFEIVGGSNFGVINDNSPDWHNTACISNLSKNTPALEGAPNICPIAGAGLDGATPAVDTTNEGTVKNPIYNIPVAPAYTLGKTIADQLVEAGKSWKSYQENVPAFGADNVNWSDGLLTNATPAPVSGVPHLYAVKHNPFAYFANVQAGTDPENSLNNIVGFERLYADLKTGHVPNFSFIAPNQCHDQHGRGPGEVGPGCSADAGTIAQGDAALKRLVTDIKASPVWEEGNNVIVTVWDENDYSSLPNQVVTIVDSNYGSKGVQSATSYNHFSLLKTLEAGFGLKYLNHAADKNVSLITDLFN